MTSTKHEHNRHKKMAKNESDARYSLSLVHFRNASDMSLDRESASLPLSHPGRHPSAEMHQSVMEA